MHKICYEALSPRQQCGIPPADLPVSSCPSVVESGAGQVLRGHIGLSKGRTYLEADQPHQARWLGRTPD